MTCRKTSWTKLGHQVCLSTARRDDMLLEGDAGMGNKPQWESWEFCFHIFSHIFTYFHIFSHIFTYFHIFSHIFTYFHIFSHIFTYFHIFSHIFTYWQIGVPKNWDRKRLLYMAEMMNKQQNKHSKFLRQGLQKACTRLSKGHGNFATTWCTSSWLNYLVSRLPFAHLVQLGFKGVSHTISKKWGTLRSVGERMIQRYQRVGTCWTNLNTELHWTTTWGLVRVEPQNWQTCPQICFMICLADLLGHDLSACAFKRLYRISTSISLVLFVKMTGNGIESRVISL